MFNLVGTVPLYLITCGNNIPLVRPWGICHSPPILWANEWFIPKNALANAIPAIDAALCILILASGSPSSTDFSRFSNTNLTACLAQPSVKSEAKIETYASIAWVNTSIPVSAAILGGIDIANSGSTIAIVGVKA